MPKTSVKKKTSKRTPKEPETMNAETADVASGTTMADVVTAIERHLEGLLSDPDAPTLLRVADALTEFYGATNPALEIELLKAIKDHPRLVISDRRRVNYIALLGEDVLPDQDGINPQNNPAEISPEAPLPGPGSKTIAEHVADAEGRPQKIAWPHDIGSSVLLLTDGHEPRKAVIKNIADRGGYALYDLVVDNGEINEVEAWRIGRDLEAEGELASMRLEIGALRRHAELGATISQKIAEMELLEGRLAENLKDHRAAIAAKYKEMADHNRAEPGQQDLRDLPEVSDAKADGQQPAATVTSIEAKIAAGDVTTLKDITVEQLMGATLTTTGSTGKPQQLTPVMFSDLPHVLVDVHGSIAILLPALDAKAWDACYAGDHARRYAIPSEVDPEQSGGRWSGLPVKVKRKTLFLAPSRDAFLVTLPFGYAAPTTESEPEACGKDAAAGE